MGTPSAQAQKVSEADDNAPTDPVTERLTAALEKAAEAGQWTVVERLAEQLERHQVRQLEAQADNVTRLPVRKKDAP